MTLPTGVRRRRPLAGRRPPASGRLRLGVAGLVLLTAMAACSSAGGNGPGGADPGGADPGGAGPGGAAPGGPDGGADLPVGTPAPTAPPADDEATVRPDAVGLRPLAWSRAEQLDARTVRVHTVLGAPPCSVLADVRITETDDAVEIALFEGREPGADCDGPVPPLGAPRFVDVHLDAPLDGRRLVDPAR